MSRISIIFARALVAIAFSAMLVSSAPVPIDDNSASIMLRSADANVASTDSRNRVLFLREPIANVASTNNRNHVLFLREAEASESVNRVDAAFLRRDN